MSLIEKQNLNHWLRWNGDISNDLLLVELQGSESLSSSFHYNIRSKTHLKQSELSLWHGKLVSCRIGDDQSPLRYIHGLITKMSYTLLSEKEAECIITLEPILSQLKLGLNSRVWHNISVPDLVKIILIEHGIAHFDIQLHNKYVTREHCMQYRESSYDFIHRLLQEEGIYYYFRHSESTHTLVLTDGKNSLHSIHGDRLIWHHDGRIISDGNVDYWNYNTSLLPSEVSISGFNIKKSSAVDIKQRIEGNNCADVIFADITPQGDRMLIEQQAQNTITANEINSCYFEANVNAHWLCSGEIFTLAGHPSGENKYQIQTLIFKATNNLDSEYGRYSCSIKAIPNDQAWHPPYRLSPPQIPGVLIAKVVGPSSEEIHTDELGRIKIQFSWEQKNKYSDTNSCWVRVAQLWTGGKFGAQFIPRVGNEVLVSFIQGHPDYPIVIGTVYNGQNNLPFDLPNQKNISGFLTRSTTGGEHSDGHQLSFDDKKGEELMTIVAQKNLSLVVKNNSSSTIAANRTTEITKGNDQLLLKEGDLNVSIERGNLHTKVVGNVATELTSGNFTLNITGGNGNIKTDKILTLESLQSIVFKVGSNKISLSPSGISISGMMIKIEAVGTTELKGAMTEITGSGMAQISGGIINIG